MKKTAAACLAALLPLPALAQDGALSGPTGLLTVPTAGVVEEGVVRAGASWHDAVPGNDGVVNYLFNIGFAPGLEVGGRLAQFGPFEGQPNDLSLNAKYAYRFASGLSIAAGGQDIGGEAQNFRSRYAVATLPWRALHLTAGYGWGPDVLEGALGGIEWRPWPFVGAYAEYDGDEVNPGLRLRSGALWAGLRIGANVGYRGATDDVEGGVQLSIPLGREPGPSPARFASDLSPLARGEASEEADRPLIQTQGLGEGDTTPEPEPIDSGRWLRAALVELGFEAVRTGTREDGTLVVALENRRYNHSSADGIGLALGTIAMRAPPSTERIELVMRAYGVTQLVVATSAPAYREFLRDGTPPVLEARYAEQAGPDVRWHNGPRLLDAAELVVEPVLRTFTATEYGMFDVAVGARGRLTVPLGRGLLVHAGVQLPLAQTSDFDDGRNFDGYAPEAGLDLLMAQYAHKLAPGWTWLWSAGLMQVYQVDVRTLGLEQLWTSPQGRHRANVKLMSLSTTEISHRVALAGYTWFDASRRWSLGATGGRFYADDRGVRFDVSRHFDDTIAGLFLKVEAADNMAGGFALTIPLTPRRDAMPRGVQVKGARRWGHHLQTTLNLADGTNALKPLLLHEPVVELDLRRDFYDSNRLGPEWLRLQLPRLREAYLLWGE